MRMENKKIIYKKKTASTKAVSKPKRGSNDDSGFTVQGEGLKYKQRKGTLSQLMT